MASQQTLASVRSRISARIVAGGSTLIVAGSAAPKASDAIPQIGWAKASEASGEAWANAHKTTERNRTIEARIRRAANGVRPPADEQRDLVDEGQAGKHDRVDSPCRHAIAAEPERRPGESGDQSQEQCIFDSPVGVRSRARLGARCGAAGPPPTAGGENSTELLIVPRSSNAAAILAKLPHFG